MGIIFESPAFKNGQPVPKLYTCDGDDISPPLDWRNLPDSVESIAIICDDPDAPMGTWIHWVIYNISSENDGIAENIPKDKNPGGGIKQGKNSWGRIGYGGPCPPRGTHRYFFKLYAVDCILPLDAGATKMEVLEAMRGHLMGQAEIMGTYSR